MIFNTTGERICYCRNLLHLTQGEFAVAFNISKPTVAHWELNIIEVPPKKVKSLIHFYHQNYLCVSEEWLMFGIGMEPYDIKNHNKPIFNFDEITLKTFTNLKLSDDTLELCQITSNFMSPVLQYADYIIGIQINNIKSLNNKLCFVKRCTEIFTGIYNNLDHRLINCYAESIMLSTTDILGEIKWIIKR